jgi:hypothetical protein
LNGKKDNPAEKSSLSSQHCFSDIKAFSEHALKKLWLDEHDNQWDRYEKRPE